MGKIFKKLFYGAIITIASLFMSEKKATAQEIAFEFANPMTNSVSNTSTLDTATTLTGEGLEKIIKETGLAGSVLARLLETTILYSAESLFATVSHELGHYRAAEKYGLNPCINIRLFANIFAHSGSCSLDWVDTPQASAQIYAAGLNQNIQNSSKIWDEIQTGKHKVYDDLAFVTNQLLTLFYNWQGREENGDYLHYMESMEDAGFELDRLRLGLNQSISTLANTQLYNSIYSIVDFIVTGNRNPAPLTIKIGKAEITPPMFEYYMTDRGEFVNAKAIINPREDTPIMIEYGRHLDETQPNTDVDINRFGLKLFDFEFKGIKFSPFAYMNLNDDFDYKGCYIGVDCKIPITKDLAVTLGVAYSHNDVIHNSIRGVDEGLGVKFRITTNLNDSEK